MINTKFVLVCTLERKLFMKYNRIFLVIMDSVGAGELPDAKDYNDTGANTLKHIAETAKGLNMPHMQALGLGNLTEIEGVAPIRPEKGYYTKCEELSVGKDTMTGHWEIMGLKITEPFRTVLNELKDAGQEVIAIGKINDIYVGEGVTEAILTKSNEDGMNQLLNVMKRDFNGLAFLNLVDFDAMYGHRRDPLGYAKCLEEFDVQLGEVLSEMKADDLLIISADHGNDPIASGSDHTREYIPVIMYSPSMQASGELPIGKSFANIGATVAENFDVEIPAIGESYLNQLN